MGAVWALEPASVRGHGRCRVDMIWVRDGGNAGQGGMGAGQGGVKAKEWENTYAAHLGTSQLLQLCDAANHDALLSVI